MIRVQQVKVPMEHSMEDIKKKVVKELRIRPEQLLQIQIRKQSIDARKKPEITYIYTVDVQVEKEQDVLRKGKGRFTLAKDVEYIFPVSGKREFENRPLIVGAGPAGIFCAYMLAKYGYRPLIIERGKQIGERTRDVLNYWESGVLDPASNVQFGEGGAGTFSDGKLNTLVKDRFGRNKEVLERFVAAGAPKEILYVNKPHIGTDVLFDVVQNLRKEIIAMGGEFRFETRLCDLIFQDGKVKQAVLASKEEEYTIQADAVVLAIGHSARDTFEMLHQRKVPMEAKSFAVGFRVEHPQQMINESQYGKQADMKKLPTAPYKLTAKTSMDRGVYSFCMCPGGHVVNASSEPGHLAVNGMSYFARDSHNANSAIIVAVTPADYPTDGPLAGVAYQRQIEKRAYELGNGRVPQQLYGDFKRNEASTGYGAFESCLKGQQKFANLRGIFCEEINEAFIEGMEQFKIPDFNREDAILSGVESRTSSPVRIPRDEQMESEIKGLFPCGEGAGYAGGIMSAAMDGLKVAEAVAAQFAPIEK